MSETLSSTTLNILNDPNKTTVDDRRLRLPAGINLRVDQTRWGPFKYRLDNDNLRLPIDGPFEAEPAFVKPTLQDLGAMAQDVGNSAKNALLDKLVQAVGPMIKIEPIIVDNDYLPTEEETLAKTQPIRAIKQNVSSEPIQTNMDSVTGVGGGDSVLEPVIENGAEMTAEQPKTFAWPERRVVPTVIHEPASILTQMYGDLPLATIEAITSVPTPVIPETSTNLKVDADTAKEIAEIESKAKLVAEFFIHKNQGERTPQVEFRSGELLSIPQKQAIAVALLLGSLPPLVLLIARIWNDYHMSHLFPGR